MADEKVQAEAECVWDPEVSAMVGTGMAWGERLLGRIFSPTEQQVFLAGYTWRRQQELAELKTDLTHEELARMDNEVNKYTEAVKERMGLTPDEDDESEEPA